MVTVYIDSDEAYPVYYFCTAEDGRPLYGDAVDVSQEKIDEWNDIQEAYYNMQQELRGLVP